MKKPLAQAWLMAGTRGLIALSFGTLALLWPDLTLFGLAAMFSAYAFLGGVTVLLDANKKRKVDDDWALPFLTGIVSICAGLIALFHPALTIYSLVLLIAANAMITGILDIATAIRVRHENSHEWLMLLNGISATAFGSLVFIFPITGALFIVMLVIAYAYLTGIFLLALAIRLKWRSRSSRHTLHRLERRRLPDRRAATAQS